jgi:hypothetical protein
MHDASRQAMVEHRIGCMYGAPGAMNLTPLKHGGSRELGHVTRWARPLRGRALGLPRPLDGVVANVLRPRTVARLEPMGTVDERVDAVWDEARRELRLAAVRDAAFYTWRFQEAPGRLADCFVVMSRGRPIAACALESLADGRVLRIVDLIAIPGAWHEALRAIARFAVDEAGAQTLDVKLFALDGRSRQMWRSGFGERESKPFLCMVPRGGDRRYLDPDRWFYTGADSDLDSQA